LLNLTNMAADVLISNSASKSELCIVTYNMHGYNQGRGAVNDIIEHSAPAVIMLQEHWLTPANLIKFNTDFPAYIAFGSSAMEHRVESGPLVGRPYGGVMILVNNDLLHNCECIHVSERFAVVKVGNVLFIAVYLPCNGTENRQLICTEVFDNIMYWRSLYMDCGCVLAGDFNSDLDAHGVISDYINKFLFDNKFSRSDLSSINRTKYTYVNESLNRYSKIDYIVYDNVCIENYDVIDPDVNFSDHLPVTVTCIVDSELFMRKDCKILNDDDSVLRLRWDRADLMSYYSLTHEQLQPIYADLLAAECDAAKCNDANLLDALYIRTVDALNACAAVTVPSHKQNFFKFWWCQELDCLKERSIESNKLWKAAGRPRSGPIFDRRCKEKREYRAGIRKYQSDSTDAYTNELHDALSQKHGNEFWKCWNSKFESKSKIRQVNGLVSPQQIVEAFATNFAKSCSNLSEGGSANLKQMYASKRPEYIGAPYSEDYYFDAELLEGIIADMKQGKAAGLDNLTAEHLQHCHPLLPCVLAKLFNLIMRTGHVPDGFGVSYTIPLLKGNARTCSKNLCTDDFRGISISPVLSKIFEHCILKKFGKFLTTSDNQFGFKKSVGCSQCIYTVRAVVDHYVNNGSTVNLCALDVSKAFDRTNHYGIYLRLMEVSIPRELLTVLENWFNKCFTCVRWGSVYSKWFKLRCGVRQGGVLSPYLFALYVDVIIDKVREQRTGCYIGSFCLSILLYADDMLLLAPSLEALQQLIFICEKELLALDLSINVKKSVCTRIGSRCNSVCGDIVTSDGQPLLWVDSIRYLGVYILRFRNFKCCFDNAKKSLYRSFNAVFGKVGRSASEEVVISLLKSKCLPCMLYGLEACPINKTEMKSLDFALTRILMKLFKTSSNVIIRECQASFNLNSVCETVTRRKINFLHKFANCDNNIICRLISSVANRELINISSETDQY